MIAVRYSYRAKSCVARCVSCRTDRTVPETGLPLAPAALPGTCDVSTLII